MCIACFGIVMLLWLGEQMNVLSAHLLSMYGDKWQWCGYVSNTFLGVATRYIASKILNNVFWSTTPGCKEGNGCCFVQ